MNNTLRYLLVPSVFVLCSYTSNYASASDSQTDNLELVYVEATRQPEDVQDIPIAVDVVDRAQLDNGTVTNSVDIGNAIPSMTVTRYTGVEPQYFIRGIGSTGSSAGEDHSVVVFSDDAYVGRTSSTALDFLDLERVEVLKGPQGTLFGRNAAGGVVQLIPIKPTAERDGYVYLGGGNLDQRQIQAALGGNLSGEDKTNARVAASYSSRDGDVTNLLTESTNLRDSEANAVRAQLEHAVDDVFAIRFSAESAHREDIGVAPRKSSSLNSPLLAGGFIPVPQPNNDLKAVTLGIDGESDQNLKAFATYVDYDFAFAQFRSVSSWRNSEFNIEEDVSGVGLILLETDENTDLYTQEFRLHSNENTSLKWTLGLYLLREEIDRSDTTDLSAISDLVNVNPVVVGLPSGVTIPDQQANYLQHAENESYALYGETEIPLSEKLFFLLGLRHTSDKKALSLQATGADPLDFGLLAAGPFTQNVEDEFEDLSGKLGLMYHASESVFSYFHLSKAYKSGGFDGNAVSVEALQSGFEPETAYSLEGGLKSSWLDNRLRINLALFFTEYRDLQVFQVTNNGTRITSNAAEAEISGFEFDIQAKLNHALKANLACTFLSTEYTEFVSDVDDNLDGLPDDLAGNSLTRAPTHSCASSLHWAPELNEDRPLHVDLSYSYQSEIYITPQNRDFDTIDAYGLANLSVSYAFTEQLTAMMTVNNLADKDYKLHTFDADPLVRNNIESSVYAVGRHWMVSLRARF